MCSSVASVCLVRQLRDLVANAKCCSSVIASNTLDSMQASSEASGNDDYFSRRNLHPRTGDFAGFSGRTSSSDVSPRSDFHEDVLSGFDRHQSRESQDMPTEADVELEGVTADGGLALNVGFDSARDSAGRAEQRQSHVRGLSGTCCFLLLLNVMSTSSLPCFHIDQSTCKWKCLLKPVSDLQEKLDGQVAATQPYKTAHSAHPSNGRSEQRVVPPLAIVLMCAGTRGDVQPFIALGLELQVLSCVNLHQHTCLHGACATLAALYETCNNL